jgi:hypothetical protein
MLFREGCHPRIPNPERGGVEHGVADGGEAKRGVVVTQGLGNAFGADQIDDPRRLPSSAAPAP